MPELEYLLDYARQKGEIAALRNAADTIEKLREALNEIADIIPGDHEELSIVHDVQAFVQRTQELEAQCAVIREALEWASDYLHNYPNDEGDIEFDLTCKRCRKALSSSAGRKILRQLQRLRAVAEEAEKVVNEWQYAALDGLREALAALRDGEPDA